MTPDKALELVGRYARLTRQIKDCGTRIGNALDLCRGLSGKRGQIWPDGAWINPPDTDNKNRDKDTHLWTWYQPEQDDDGTMHPRLVWTEPGEDEAAECPHCWAAHQAIQERKQAKRQLAAVRGAMSRMKA